MAKAQRGRVDNKDASREPVSEGLSGRRDFLGGRPHSDRPEPVPMGSGAAIGSLGMVSGGAAEHQGLDPGVEGETVVKATAVPRVFNRAQSPRGKESR